DCYKEVYEHLKDEIDEIEQKKGKDLLLQVYLSAGGALVDQAAAKIKEKVGKRHLDLSKEEDRVLNKSIQEYCKLIPAIFGTEVELQIKMNTQDDAKLARQMQAQINNRGIRRAFSGVGGQGSRQQAAFQAWLNSQP